MAGGPAGSSAHRSAAGSACALAGSLGRASSAAVASPTIPATAAGTVLAIPAAAATPATAASVAAARSATPKLVPAASQAAVEGATQQRALCVARLQELLQLLLLGHQVLHKIGLEGVVAETSAGCCVCVSTACVVWTTSKWLLSCVHHWASTKVGPSA